MTLSINLPTNIINTITKNHLFNFQTITFFVKLTKIVKFPTLKFKNNVKRIEVVQKIKGFQKLRRSYILSDPIRPFMTYSILFSYKIY